MSGLTLDQIAEQLTPLLKRPADWSDLRTWVEQAEHWLVGQGLLRWRTRADQGPDGADRYSQEEAALISRQVRLHHQSVF
jgi:hypothetical protein